jgi:hypothetical protein
VKPSISIRRELLWMMGLLVATATGCGGAYDATVSGMVTLDGKSVNRGTVAFHPTAGGPAAYARVSDDGSYYVRTGREEGLPAGEYVATIVANEPPAESHTKLGGPPPPGKPITPPWYRTTKTSGLQFKVEPGDNEFNLELKSQPPAGWNPSRRP